MSFKKVCKVCGRTFHSAKYSSRFCSENCYVKAKNWAQETRYLLDKEGDMRTLNQILYHKECLYCGAPFTAKNTRAVYCSPRCGKLHRKAKSDAVKVASGSENSGFKLVVSPSAPREFYIPKVCVCCGKEFIAQRVTTMFCSNACARKYRAKQKLEEKHKRITAETVRQNIAIRDMNSPDSEYIMAADAARFLGLSKRTMIRYIQQGIVKAKKLPKMTLIEKKHLREILESDVSYRVRTKVKIDIPKDDSNPIFGGEYMTITEAAATYDIPLNVMQHYLRRSDLQFVKYRNTRFYKKKDVDRLIKKRIKDRHPEIKEWYSVDDILSTFNITFSYLAGFLYRSSIPKRKDGGKTYYSKEHIDQEFTYLLEIDKYYTTEELAVKYGADKRKIAKLVQRHNLPKITRGSKIYIEKEPFDHFMRLNKHT